MLLRITTLLCFSLTLMLANAQHDDHGHDHSDHGHEHESEHHGDCGHHGDEEYDPTATAMHHISDANVYTILDWIRIPLPTILYAKDQGWDVFMSSKFHPGHHDNGHTAYKNYVLHEGNVKRIIDPSYQPSDHAVVDGFTHETKEVDGKNKDIYKACIGGEKYLLESKSTLDGGLLGGGITGFFDFSITKNVMSMILVSLLFGWLCITAARGYKKREGQAPKGVQSFLEPVFVYLRDEVGKPFIGAKYMKWMPLLLSIFFFILGLNLWGQVPFFGGTNVTGNLTVTMVIALIVFLITNFNGNKHYWQHIFWMPGVPVMVKPLLAIIEFMSLFIKPLTLMLRLAGNITAGHIAILSFIGFVFIFGESGKNLGGGILGAVMSTLLTAFMMAIELIVAFVQAYVFTMLTASYIGAATEEHDHH